MSYSIQEHDSEQIHFLYQVSSGVCDKSFALNVARLAGVSSGVIKRAMEIAEN